MSALRVLRPKQVSVLVGLSLMQIWRLRQAHRFPEPISLGANSRGFLQNEIDAWIEARIAERDARLAVAEDAGTP